MAVEDEGAGTGVVEGAQTGADDGSQAGGEQAEGAAEGSGASDEDRLAESLAAELGWSPKDKWRGPETDWRDARSFLKTTVEVNKARGREIKQLNERVERIARTSASMADRAAAQERERLIGLHERAVDEKDADTALRVSQAITQLDASTAPAPDSAVSDFKERNASWIDIDPLATAVAFNVCEVWARKGADASKQLEEAEKIVRQRFPEHFGEPEPKPKPAKQPGGEVPGSRAADSPRRGPKGYNDLPAEAKTAALDFEKRGRATKEEYAKEYWKENA